MQQKTPKQKNKETDEDGCTGSISCSRFTHRVRTDKEHSDSQLLNVIKPRRDTLHTEFVIQDKHRWWLASTIITHLVNKRPIWQPTLTDCCSFIRLSWISQLFNRRFSDAKKQRKKTNGFFFSVWCSRLSSSSHVGLRGQLAVGTLGTRWLTKQVPGVCQCSSPYQYSCT